MHPCPGCDIAEKLQETSLLWQGSIKKMPRYYVRNLALICPSQVEELKANPKQHGGNDVKGYEELPRKTMKGDPTTMGDTQSATERERESVLVEGRPTTRSGCVRKPRLHLHSTRQIVLSASPNELR